jgi:hypothetical protein
MVENQKLLMILDNIMALENKHNIITSGVAAI